MLRLTKTKTGIRSSAAGTDLSWERLRRFMMMVETLVMHWTFSSGILKAANLLNSAWRMLW